MDKVNVQKLHSFSGHREGVYTLQPSSIPNIFFSAAGDGFVVSWNLDQPDQGELIAKLPSSVYALHHHAATDVLVAGQNFEGIHVLDWKNKKEVGSLALTKAAIFDIQSYGNAYLVATGDGSLIKVDARSLTILQKNQPTEKSARSIAVHPSRAEVAVGYSDHSIRVFDLENLLLKHVWQAHGNSVFTVRYTPDGGYLLSGSRDARLKFWDTQNEYALAQEIVAHMYAINHLEFSPDAKHFVTCSMDKSIKVWDTEERKLLKVIDKARHAGHGTSVNKLLWTSHQGQLLSASDDRTISVWNITFEIPAI